MKYILSIMSAIVVLGASTTAFATRYAQPVSTNVTLFEISETPTIAYVGDTITATIKAKDSNGNVVKSFSGAVNVSINNYNDGGNISKDILPLGGIFFQPSDNGIKTFNITFIEPGIKYFSNYMPENPAVQGSFYPITVLPKPTNTTLSSPSFSCPYDEMMHDEYDEVFESFQYEVESNDLENKVGYKKVLNIATRAGKMAMRAEQKADDLENKLTTMKLTEEGYNQYIARINKYKCVAYKLRSKGVEAMDMFADSVGIQY